MRRYPRFERWATRVAGAALLSGVSLPSTAEPNGARTIEEILVTARRREEPLQDVPISTSVLSGVDLERRQVTDIATLQYAVPNLSVTPWPGARTRVNVGMRGQLEADLLPTLDPAVGIYLDGVYIARVNGANLDLIDVDRVEVLRGPQGTLYGRNTIGGSINVIPVRPLSEFSGTLSAGVGDYQRRDVTAILNVPTADDAYAVRLAASHSEHEGYGRNTLLDHDLNLDDRDFARLQLKIAPSDRWDINVALDYTRADAARNLLTLVFAFSPNTLVPAASGHPNDSLANYEDGAAHDVSANRLGVSEAEVWGASATLTVEWERFTVKSISAYRELESSDQDADLDGTPYDLFTVFDRDERQDQFSQELQAYGDALQGRLSWIGGVHYFREEGEFDQRVLAIDPATLNGAINQPGGSVTNDSISAYTQLTYNLLPTVRMAAGVRYNEDGRQLTSRNARDADTCLLAPEMLDEPGVCRAALPTRHFSYVPYTVGIDYTPAARTLLFAKVSRGNRAGGYNMRGTTESNLDTFEPEQVTAYEVGGRADLLGGRLSIDLSLYRSLFEDIQLLERAPTTGTTLTIPVIRNGGEARIDGGELQLAARLGMLQLGAIVGVTDAEYTKLDPRALDTTLESSFLQTPDTTAAFAADLPIRFGFGEMNLHVDYSWRDDVAFRADPNTLARQDAFGLTNAVLSARFDRSGVGVQLWGRNLADERHLDRLTQGSLVTAMPGDPRTYGVSLSVSVGGGSRR